MAAALVMYKMEHVKFDLEAFVSQQWKKCLMTRQVKLNQSIHLDAYRRIKLELFYRFVSNFYKTKLFQKFKFSN